MPTLLILLSGRPFSQWWRASQQDEHQEAAPDASHW